MFFDNSLQAIEFYIVDIQFAAKCVFCFLKSLKELDAKMSEVIYASDVAKACDFVVASELAIASVAQFPLRKKGQSKIQWDDGSEITETYKNETNGENENVLVVHHNDERQRDRLADVLCSMVKSDKKTPKYEVIGTSVQSQSSSLRATIAKMAKRPEMFTKFLAVVNSRIDEHGVGPVDNAEIFLGKKGRGETDAGEFGEWSELA